MAIVFAPVRLREHRVLKAAVQREATREGPDGDLPGRYTRPGRGERGERLQLLSSECRFQI